MSICAIDACLPQPCIGITGAPKPEIYVINADDIDTVEYNTDNSVKNIILNAGKQAYKIEAVPQSTGNYEEFQYSIPNRFLKTSIPLTNTSMSQSATNLMQKLLLGNFVVLAWGTVLNDAVPPINKETRMKVYGLQVPLHGEVGTFGYGMKPEDPSGNTITLVTNQASLAPELVPDPTIYTSDSPIKEFLDTLQAFNYCTA